MDLISSDMVYKALVTGISLYASYKCISWIKEITAHEHSYNTTVYGKRSERNPDKDMIIAHQTMFKNKDDLYIRWTKWEPKSEVKGVVVICHGLNEYSARYNHVAEHMNLEGYKVYAIDHQGHGRSEGDRMYAKSVWDMVDDMIVLTQKVKEENPGKKLFLLGHSMGGLLAILTTLKIQDLFTAAIYSAPALYLDPQQFPPILLTLLAVVAKIFPKLRLVPLDISTLCKDKDVYDVYVNDPLVSTLPPTVGLQNVLNHGMKVANTRAGEITLPVLMIHGTGDKVVLMKGSEIFIDEISSKDKQLKLYDGGFHESFNDPNHLRLAVKDVMEFLNAHC